MLPSLPPTNPDDGKDPEKAFGAFADGPPNEAPACGLLPKVLLPLMCDDGCEE